MSLHIAAKHLAAQGRGPDTQLVHMAPREVAGLQAIAKAHGGSLTVNPETGLAEAGFLSRILPAVIGAGLAATGVGAPMAALMVGGGYGLATGDLNKGLMAGLGAYGGAGLGQGVVTPEAATTQTAAAAPVAAPVPTGVGADVNGLTMDSGMTASAPVPPPAPVTPPTPTTGFDRFSANLEAKPSYGLAAASSAMMDPTRPQIPGTEKYTGPLSRYSMSENYQPYDQQQPNPYYQPQYKTYAAGGGVIEQMSDANAIGQNTGFPQANIHQGAYATPWQTPISQNVVEGTADTGVDQVTGEENRFAAGGHLGSYSDGGHMLKGPGDGMSDSIPAKIGAKQPARLADGEFVVPADVVSHLGNGSSDAGAKQLYAMMDRIRQQRTGKKKQAPQVNPTKSMPA